MLFSVAQCCTKLYGGDLWSDKEGFRDHTNDFHKNLQYYIQTEICCSREIRLDFSNIQRSYIDEAIVLENRFVFLYLSCQKNTTQPNYRDNTYHSLFSISEASLFHYFVGRILGLTKKCIPFPYNKDHNNLKSLRMYIFNFFFTSLCNYKVQVLFFQSQFVFLSII